MMDGSTATSKSMLLPDAAVDPCQLSYLAQCTLLEAPPLFRLGFLGAGLDCYPVKIEVESAKSSR